MNYPGQVKAILKNGVIDIDVRISLPAVGKASKDAKQKPAPARFVQQLSVKSEDRLLAEAQYGLAVAANPVFSFRAKGLVKGASINVEWTDSQGDKGSASTTVKTADQA